MCIQDVFWPCIYNSCSWSPNQHNCTLMLNLMPMSPPHTQKKTNEILKDFLEKDRIKFVFLLQMEVIIILPCVISVNTLEYNPKKESDILSTFILFKRRFVLFVTCCAGNPLKVTKSIAVNVIAAEKRHKDTLFGPSKRADAQSIFTLMCMEGVPGQRAAPTQPLVLYVAPQNILGSLEQHWKRHPGDVALLRGGHLVAEGKLQQRFKTHLRELLPHPHINLSLCRHRTV